MGGLGPLTQTGSLLRGFLLDFFEWGLVLADRSPSSPRVDFHSTSSYCCVNYT